MEEQLDAEQLESLKKYQERKQQRQTPTYTYTQVTHKPTKATYQSEAMQMSGCMSDMFDSHAHIQQLGQHT